MSVTRAQMEAIRRRNFAQERIAAMRPEQRLSLTIDRLTASYGISEIEASAMLKQFGRS